MSKPIKLTNDMRVSILKQISLAIQQWGKASDVTTLLPSFDNYEDKTATLFFTPLAYFKMFSLIDSFDGEVAWHGVVDRVDGGFCISDILVYPQTVSSSTVNTDQKEYEQWLMSFDDDVFNRIRFQGHSHVNFGTSPSGVDITHQERIISMLSDDDYYVFLIMNKKHEFYARIVDNANNIEYESKDVDIKIVDDLFDFEEFLAEANKVVEKKTYTYPSIGSQSFANSYESYKKSNRSKKQTKQKYYGDYRDFENPYYGD